MCCLMSQGYWEGLVKFRELNYLVKVRKTFSTKTRLKCQLPVSKYFLFFFSKCLTVIGHCCIYLPPCLGLNLSAPRHSSVIRWSTAAYGIAGCLVMSVLSSECYSLSFPSKKKIKSNIWGQLKRGV